MATKKNTKKISKIDPLAYDKWYLGNIINCLQKCADENTDEGLKSYFQRKADLNREKLKGLK